MIIKMQRSVDSFPKGEEAILLTNKERTVEIVTDNNQESIRSLKGRNTAYFESRFINGCLAIGQEVSGW